MHDVYLGGPIGHCSDSEAAGWRDDFADHWNTLDPMRRDYRAGWDDPHRVVRLDLEDIRSCRVALFNCWKVSPGTMMEIVYARQAGASVVVVWPHKPSPWIETHADHVCADIETAAAVVDCVLDRMNDRARGL